MHRRSGLNILFPIIFAFLTFLLITAGWWIWRVVKNDGTSQLLNASNLLSSYYQLTFNHREISLLNLGQRLYEVSGPDQAEERLRIVNQSLAIYDDLSAIGFADTSGQILTLSGSMLGQELPNLRQMSETNRSFDEVKSNSGMVIGEVYYFDKVNDWIIPIRVPVRDSKGNLTSINTCGVIYSKLIDNLESFGLPESYQVHLINNTHQTTQLYYPLDRRDYTKVLHNPATIYQNVDTLNVNNDQVVFQAYNTYEAKEIEGVSLRSEKLKHTIVVSISEEVFKNAFWDSFNYVLLAYLIFMMITIISYGYFSRTEIRYINDLQSERDYSNRIINSTPALIIGLNRELTCTFINPTAEALLGYQKETTNGQDCLCSMFGKESISDLPTVIQLLPTKSLNNQIIEVFDKNGLQKSIIWSSVNTLDENGHVNEIFLFGSDQTEKEEALQQLRESEQKLQKYSDDLEGLVYNRTRELEEANAALKTANHELQEILAKLKQTQNQLVQHEKMASLGILSAGIGHEINNPLNFIRNGVYALESELNEDPNSENIWSFITIINEGVDRASEIVKSLASFSRQAEDINETCDIEQIINNALIILQNQLKYKTEIIKNFNHQKIKIYGNSGKLHQAFLNILSNAEQAIETTGIITIESGINNNHLWVSISDTGHGIEQELLDKISDPFYTTKEPGKGTGLGLSITYSIIQEHKGEIRVLSDVGKGTTFTVELPL